MSLNDQARDRRILTIWLPRWPVQRRLLERPELRRVPLFVCQRTSRGVLNVVSWGWAAAPATPRVAITPGMSLAESMAVLALAHGSRACHLAEIDHDDPAADLSALEHWARWCHRFSPAVMIEPAVMQRAHAPSPDCLHLDVTGTAGFFGGETPLVCTVVWTLAARGLHARAAIADTPAAAFAAAHHTDVLVGCHTDVLVGCHTDVLAGCHGANRSVQARAVEGRSSQNPGPATMRWRTGRKRRWAVVPPGAAPALLAELPAAALRLSPDVLEGLREVGVETIGSVLKLPAKSLASRFPAELSRRRHQFLGTLAEPWMGAQSGIEALPQAEESFGMPLAAADLTEDMLTALVERLLARCVQPLAARGAGVLALQVRLFSAASPSAESPSVRRAVAIDVGLFQPSQSLRHLGELVRLRLGHSRLCGEVSGIVVEVVAAGPIVCRQRSLFSSSSIGMPGQHQATIDGWSHAHCETAASRAAAVGMLLDRLSGRLGRGAVFEPRVVSDPQPEHAWVPIAPMATFASWRSMSRRQASCRQASGVESRRPQGGGGRSGPGPGRRPIWMPPRPVRLERPIAVAPDGPLVRFKLDGHMHAVVAAHGPERIETAWWRGPTVRRDYYVIETDTGGRLWVFRHLREGSWFLHGIFA